MCFDCEEIGYDLIVDGKDRVKTMHASGWSQGHVGGLKMADISATVRQPVGSPIDLRKVWLDEQVFAATIEEDDGTVISFAECQIASIGGKTSSGPGLTMDVKIEALRVSIDRP